MLWWFPICSLYSLSFIAPLHILFPLSHVQFAEFNFWLKPTIQWNEVTQRPFARPLYQRTQLRTEWKISHKARLDFALMRAWYWLQWCYLISQRLYSYCKGSNHLLILFKLPQTPETPVLELNLVFHVGLFSLPFDVAREGSAN